MPDSLICLEIIVTLFGVCPVLYSGAPCPTDYPLRSVSGRFGSAVVSRNCGSVGALSHLLDVVQRARVFETLPTKQDLRLWL